MVIFFFRLEKAIYFGLIWSKNSKLSVEAEIWSLYYFEYGKFDGDFHLGF